MSKKGTDPESHGHAPTISKKAYKDSLRHLQVELVKLQRHFIKCNDKILIILEGRDASGKDGTIKRIVQHLSPREPELSPLANPLTATVPLGTSSVMFLIGRRPRNSCSLTAVGITVPASSG